MAKIELSVDELSLINRALSDSMNYKPDDSWDEKWSLLLKLTRSQLELEKAEKVKEQTKTEEKSVLKRCPWYVTLGRILMILLLALFLFWCSMSLAFTFISIFDKLFGLNIAELIGIAAMENPVLAIVLAVGIYLVFLSKFITEMIKGM